MIADTVTLGKNVNIYQPDLVNLYGCTIGDDTKIGAFVEIQKNALVGSKCKISSHSFICEGVTIEDEVFIGIGSTLRDRVVVGKNCLIGASSNIVKNTEPDSVYYGNPAKLVKKIKT